MSDGPQLVIKLGIDGSLKAETRNIHGDKCVPYAAILEDLCDAEAIESSYTQDYYLSRNEVDEPSVVEDHDHA